MPKDKNIEEPNAEVLVALSEEFDSIEDWLEALKRDSSRAIIPALLAAEALEESIASFKRKLAGGNFPFIMIAGRRYAMAEAVRILLEERTTLQNAVKDSVEEVARRRDTIFYGDLMEVHGMSWRNPNHRKQIGIILGKLSHWSWEEHGILLSSIVHRKGMGQTGPGKGYLDLMEIFEDQYENFDYEPGEDVDDMVQRHMEAVWDHYAGKKLRPRNRTRG